MHARLSKCLMLQLPPIDYWGAMRMWMNYAGHDDHSSTSAPCHGPKGQAVPVMTTTCLLMGS
eukprot:scaffold189956_cov43-Prasinocladus_malaysianus.AAC.2